MIRQQRRWPWLGAMFAAACMLAGAVTPAAAAEANPAPRKTPKAVIPDVPAELLGHKPGPVGPPPTRPVIRPTPSVNGTVTFTGTVRSGVNTQIPPLRLFGPKGTVEIQGDITVRLSGQGTLWVDGDSSISLDSATTGTKVSEGAGVRYEKFSGTARVSGNAANVKFVGQQIFAIGGGAGKFTASGEGSFLTIQSGRLVSGIWNQEGVTQEFNGARFQTVKASGELTTSPLQIIPDAPPRANVRTYAPPRLPSEGGQTQPLAGPSAPPGAPGAAPAPAPVAPAP